MSERQWFYGKNRQQVGPIPEEEMIRLLAQGALDGETLVWAEGMPNWVPAASIPGLVTVNPCGAPPPPPLSARGASEGLALASLILGILAVVLGICVIGGLFGIIGLILGVIHAMRGRSRRLMAGWGIGLSLAGCVLSATILSMFILASRPASTVRQKVLALEGADSARIYESILSELAAGRQSEAESMLDVFVKRYPNDQRLVFARAVCDRSRWSINKADREFSRVLALNPATIEGKCARYLLDLDEQENVENGFKGLRILLSENPRNPLLLWMFAVQCRDHYRRTNRTDLSAEGARAYERLLEIFQVGPVLVHQTYANTLSEELGLHEEALKHRRIAVQMEPKAWTYQGLANTLAELKNYREANEAYAKLVELDPDDSMNWYHWANSLAEEGRHDEAISKCQEVLHRDPSNYRAYNVWGWCLDKQGRYKEAVAQYEKSITVHPAASHPYQCAAQILLKMGDTNESRKMRQRELLLPK